MLFWKLWWFANPFCILSSWQLCENSRKANLCGILIWYDWPNRPLLFFWPSLPPPHVPLYLHQVNLAMFVACSTLLNQTELIEKVKRGQTKCWVKWAQNKQRSGTVFHMHNSRFADAEVGRTLNQLTTLRSSKLRADWPGSSKDGSPQSGGFPEGSSQLN